LENLRSRIRKFPKAGFLEGCKDWNIVMSGWRLMRDSVPDRFIELDQRILAENPPSAANAVGGLLALDSHEIDAFAAILRNDRPESTGQSSTFVADISELGWSADQIETFRQTCGAEMEAYGYTYDATYCR
jgi:hypothetical protein